jgi:hypothetical protein
MIPTYYNIPFYSDLHKWYNTCIKLPFSIAFWWKKLYNLNQRGWVVTDYNNIKMTISWTYMINYKDDYIMAVMIL